MQIVPNWIKKVAEETDANRKRFFDLFESALPGGMRKMFSLRAGDVNYHRRYGSNVTEAPDKNSKHAGKMGDKIKTLKSRLKSNPLKSYRAM
jgi:hypothetical protein